MRITIPPNIYTQIRICSRLLMAFFISLTVSIATAEENTAVDDTQLGRLAILPELPTDKSGCISKVYIQLNGKVIAERSTEFDAPLLFKDIPAGLIKILVIPRMNSKAGYIGESKAVVEKDKLTTTRISLVRQESSVLKVQIRDIEGKPLSDKPIWFGDVTEENIKQGHNHATDADGCVTIHIFPKREYQSIYNTSNGFEILKFRSPRYKFNPIAAKQEAVWQLQKPKTLTIRLIEKTENGIVLVKQIKRLHVKPDAGGNGYPCSVKDGELVLAKEGIVLQGASKAYINLTSSHVGFEIKNNLITINDKPSQRVDVEFVAICDVKVALQTDVAKAEAYLVRHGVKQAILRPSQTVTVKSGSYKMIAWAPGYTVQENEVIIDGKKTCNLSYKPEKVSSVEAKVLDEEGKAVTKGEVRGRYAAIKSIPTQRVEVGKDGQFTIALDQSRTRLLAVVTDKGGQFIELAEKESLKGNVLIFQTPCIVTGKILREERLMTSLFPGTNMKSRPIKQRIFLFDSSCHDLLLAEGYVAEDGSFHFPAQPGKYDVVLFAVGDGVAIGQIDIKKGDLKLDMGDVKVTKSLWKKAESVPSHVK